MTRPTPFETLWLTETIRLREEHAGPLEDQEASRRARHGAGELTGRIQQRALLLAERDGLLDALRHWRQGARLALLALLLLAIVSGAGLAGAALGQEPVNVFWAVGSLLGLNLVLLAGWALGLLFASGEGAGLGRLWLWLSGKLARDARAAQLGPALVLMLQRRRLNRWALGATVHGVWLVALFSALLTLLALLATRRYGFVWETTILGSDTFVHLTRSLGALPALLGFSVPDEAMVRASGDGALADARQAWAGWLVGVLLIYGVLPRLLLATLCLLRWKAGRARLTLDLELPGYSMLRERLMPSSERLGVNDPAPARLPEVQSGAATGEHQGAVLVAIELDSQRPWPPKLAPDIADAGVLDSRESRRTLLDQLTRYPPARLLIACDPRRSPDRGSLALIAELARCAGATRLWLLPAPTGQALDADRLGNWHAALDELRLPWAYSAPLTWLETGHD